MKTSLTCLFIGLAASCLAQIPQWTTRPLNLPIAENGYLGTFNKRSLSLMVNDTTRVQIDSLGRLRMKSMGFTPSSDGELRFLYVDQNGYVSRGVPTPEIICGKGTTPWVLGGNTIALGITNNNTIGTCNNVPFILKANNIQSFYITPSGKIGAGPGNSSPLAAFDLKNGSNSFRIYADASGNLEATSDLSLNYGSSHNLFFNEGPAGGANTAMAIVAGGFVGLGTVAPSEKLHVIGNTQVTGNSYVSGKLRVNCNAASFPTYQVAVVGNNEASAVLAATGQNEARLAIANSLLYYKFYLDNTNSAIGHIGDGANDFINFHSYGYPTSYPQVWIGKSNAKPLSPHDDFMFAVAGKMVAQSIYVTANTNTNWADYVFADNYKLRSLAELESYYKANKHLPEIPSAAEIAEKGIDVGEMNTVLVKKVEELTLYIVEQQKTQQKMQQEIETLKAKLK